ncbi:four helix bundle protein [Flavilitoribacter nigricans]|uniref:Four helix bundle protein n=1 Tax=Flavilitoribacter nigricans (strain ATCC 23147 / DSM 23189 / NBRC 102662 / NCIMB 1420 / SS-2) TaxID=1122177 RepID=A0A2D0N398_FLAN2|nr:four helix bundle protein [Flavilitoribacter nigricans]PHN02870.1 four helix bundle protein [Flavilitoribacter nigricans DSM 23189 = NBRC 102662]
MAKIEKFEDLQCWQKARELTRLVYSLEGPITTNWSIKDQFQRASLSIMNNIAEGFNRFSNREKIRFLEIAQSSANEVKSMIYVLKDLNYLIDDQITELFMLVEETKAKILGLIRYLKNKG